MRGKRVRDRTGSMHAVDLESTLLLHPSASGCLIHRDCLPSRRSQPLQKRDERRVGTRGEKERTTVTSGPASAAAAAETATEAGGRASRREWNGGAADCIVHQYCRGT